MKKKLNFETFKNEALQDKAFEDEYEALRPEFAVFEQYIKARKQVRLVKDHRAS